MTQDTMVDSIEDPVLDEDARRSKLTVHLAKLVHAGAKLEMEHGLRAIVVRTEPQRYLPNVFMALLGIIGFAMTREPLFILAGGIAMVGWHRKLVAGIERVRVVVRVDESGRISEQVVEAT